jgi:hypothetical protein
LPTMRHGILGGPQIGVSAQPKLVAQNAGSIGISRHVGVGVGSSRLFVCQNNSS